ncbi:MAG TPA: hypothetical protein VMN57_16595 [Anaerolineales bacterium]|nr:hypothetical protein [Anaerolineales bacterium]
MHRIAWGVFFSLCLTVAAAANWKAQPAEAASPASLVLGTTLIGEGDDFATRVIGIPWWNMNGAPYPDYFIAVQDINRNSFKVTENGFWEMTSTTQDPGIWLHWPGISLTQRVLRMGDTRPIDANKYKLLSYYMCLEKAPAPDDFDWAANVFWMYDQAPHENPNNGRTKFVLFVNQGLFKNDGDCELITYDLSQPSSWSVGTWNNSPNMLQGFRLDMINQPDQKFSIGWVRLTTKNTANPVPFVWSGAPPGENKFFVSLSGCGQDGVLVGKQSGSSGTFSWGAQVHPGFSDAHPLPLPESFEPGSYFLYMQDSSGGIACAANNPLKISTAPLLEFLKPSFLSGPDFASIERYDPWGLGSASDIDKMNDIASASFDNGILKLTASPNDPQLQLNLNGLRIDTSKYYYATFRMKMNAIQVGGQGWVQRWVWWYDGGPNVDHITTRDMRVFENWHTYTIDLRTAPAEACPNNCWTGLPKVFRFDPIENFVPTSLELDYFMLTGGERITQGNMFPIYYTTTAQGNATVRFYYDADKNPGNGRTLIGSHSLVSNEQPQFLEFGPHSIFLPGVSHIKISDINHYDGSRVFYWNTGSVPKATFYISADVDDGIVVTTWYSEIPVTIE